MEYSQIRTEADIERFLDEVNGLHDGHVLSVQYENRSIRHMPDGGYRYYPEETTLRIRILVTSIWDAVAELVFYGIGEWKIHNSYGWDYSEAGVFFLESGDVVWIGDASVGKDYSQSDDFVIADRMEYRIES